MERPVRPDTVTVVAFHPIHQEEGYPDDFFGVAVDDAKHFELCGGFAVDGVDGVDGEDGEVEFITCEVTNEMPHTSDSGGDEGSATGVVYIYIPYSSDGSSFFANRIGRPVLVGDQIRFRE